MPESAHSSEPRIGTLAILGVGLIGGSIAAAARRRGLAQRIVGIGRNPSRLETATQLGLIDCGSTDIAVAADADLAVVCTPVNHIVADAKDLAAVLNSEALITDVGSTKGIVCEELADLDGSNGPAFVGSHPLTGSQLQGFEHADPELFEGRVCVVTPFEASRDIDIQAIEQFWSDLGSVVVRCEPREHDRALARTSHLPHLVAAALAGNLLASDTQFAASGFRDTTRIASGDPGLWIPILNQNNDAIQQALAQLKTRLEEFSDALQHDDDSALQKLLEEAKRQRDGLD
ncbi:MAG: prephenate dehydrogenase [Planctomycetaceae bacterium]